MHQAFGFRAVQQTNYARLATAHSPGKLATLIAPQALQCSDERKCDAEELQAQLLGGAFVGSGVSVQRPFLVKSFSSPQ